MSVDDIKIVGWIKNSLIDFPRTVSTVLFLSGCNLRCPYCHNSKIVLGEEDAIPFSDIEKFLTKRFGLVDGVVVSGGEPTLYDDLPELFHILKELGYKTKLDTNGTNPRRIVECQPDYIALDIKTSFDKYKQYLGASSDGISDSIELVRQWKDSAEIRITCAPGIVNDADIKEIIERVSLVSKVYLQPFVASPTTMVYGFPNGLQPITIDKLKEWQKLFNDNGIECCIRNI